MRKINTFILTPESCSLSLSVGFSIQDEAVDVARSAPQGAHYHADVIYLLLLLGIKQGASIPFPANIFYAYHTPAFYTKYVILVSVTEGPT